WIYGRESGALLGRAERRQLAEEQRAATGKAPAISRVVFPLWPADGLRTGPDSRSAVAAQAVRDHSGGATHVPDQIPRRDRAGAKHPVLWRSLSGPGARQGCPGLPDPARLDARRPGDQSVDRALPGCPADGKPASAGAVIG